MQYYLYFIMWFNNFDPSADEARKISENEKLNYVKIGLKKGEN